MGELSHITAQTLLVSFARSPSLLLLLFALGCSILTLGVLEQRGGIADVLRNLEGVVVNGFSGARLEFLHLAIIGR